MLPTPKCLVSQKSHGTNKEDQAAFVGLIQQLPQSILTKQSCLFYLKKMI